ncbi:Fic family protein [bacterium]|jgi:Fic family protein|nr:Fic family protein [bacterium]
MSFEPRVPYNQLPKLPPKESCETPEVFLACISAARKLAELKQAGESIPNQSMLINTIPLLEAQMSSAIENIVTTTDKLFQQASLLNSNADVATKETLRYRTALNVGFEEAKTRPVTMSTATKICQILLNVDLNVRKLPGTVIANSKTGKVIYTPPAGESVIRELLTNWERYLHETRDVDPLIKMAVSHYQFEAIHPFTDGNGRTGRILNILFLIQEGLLNIPILYLSRYFLYTKSDYYKLLNGVTQKNSWIPWILYVLAGVEETSTWTLEKIRNIRLLLRHTCEFAQKKLPKVYSRELIDILFTQPYCRISNVTDAGLVQRETASLHLRQLAKIGVVEVTQHGRDKVFCNKRLLELLQSVDHQWSQFT